MAKLEPFPPAEKGPVFKHGNGLRMECPVGAFSRAVRASGNLDEAVVEAEVVSKTILPTLGVLAVVWEVVHDELIDITKRQHTVMGVI